MKVEKLSVTLRKVLGARGLGARFELYRVLGQWEDAVGTVIARHTQPLTLRAKKLAVQVDSPVWMQQLALMRTEIVGKVNRALGYEVVKDIVLSIGTITRAGRPAAERTPLPELTDAERAEAEKAAAGIEDPEIRAALARFLQKDLRSKKARRTEGGRS